MKHAEKYKKYSYLIKSDVFFSEITIKHGMDGVHDDVAKYLISNKYRITYKRQHETVFLYERITRALPKSVN